MASHDPSAPPADATPGAPAAPTFVLLIRHGVTPTTGQVLPGRTPGLHLSDAGHDQARRVAERLTGVPLAALYTSPLERTRETAAPTAAATGLTPEIDEGLIECDFGDWTGKRLADLAKLPEWDTVQRAPSTFRFPGGESFADMQHRMVTTLDALAARHTGQVIACFSHADTIKVALAHALGTPLDSFQRIGVNPASISVVGIHEDGRAEVAATNTTAGPLTDVLPARR